ncbi:hypothetical protein B0H10DRAFT_2220548 [Mycena sp. CBHHK59/15]|nr:hypothetical protein B0H10DRAFT_2220548 [Mycena sp. CBHHK59/15]
MFNVVLFLFGDFCTIGRLLQVRRASRTSQSQTQRNARSPGSRTSKTSYIVPESVTCKTDLLNIPPLVSGRSMRRNAERALTNTMYFDIKPDAQRWDVPPKVLARFALLDAERALTSTTYFDLRPDSAT